MKINMNASREVLATPTVLGLLDECGFAHGLNTVLAQGWMEGKDVRKLVMTDKQNIRVEFGIINADGSVPPEFLGENLLNAKRHLQLRKLVQTKKNYVEIYEKNHSTFDMMLESGTEQIVKNIDEVTEMLKPYKEVTDSAADLTLESIIQEMEMPTDFITYTPKTLHRLVQVVLTQRDKVIPDLSAVIVDGPNVYDPLVIDNLIEQAHATLVHEFADVYFSSPTDLVSSISGPMIRSICRDIEPPNSVTRIELVCILMSHLSAYLGMAVPRAYTTVKHGVLSAQIGRQLHDTHFKKVIDVQTRARLSLVA